MNIIFLVAILFSPVFSTAEDSAHFIKRLLYQVNADKTANPEKYKRIRSIIGDFSDCMASQKISDKNKREILCGAVLSKSLSKLKENVEQISEAQFGKELNSRALNDLATEYADISFRFKALGQKKFPSLCEDLEREAVYGKSPCGDNLKGMSKSSETHLEKLSSQKLPSIETLVKDYDAALTNIFESKTYIKKCEKTKLELERVTALKKGNSERLEELNYELAQTLVASAVAELKAKQHPLATIFYTDDSLESTLVPIKDQRDPFNPDLAKFQSSVNNAKKRIRMQTAELLGFGDKDNVSASVADVANANKVKSIDFFAKNYPRVLGQLLLDHPDMVKKVCGFLNDKGNFETNDLVEEVIEPLTAEQDKRLSEFLITGVKTCEEIENHYSKSSKKLNRSQILEIKRQFNNKIKSLGTAAMIPEINAEMMKPALKIQQDCKTEAFERYQADIMTKAIHAAKQLEEDPELLKNLREFYRKTGQSQSDDEMPIGEKINIMLAVVARLPKEKLDENKKSQPELVAEIRRQLSEGHLNIDALTKAEDTFCFN